jgi:hypothetical protein
LGQETRGCLDGLACSGITAHQCGPPQLCNSEKAVANASGEYLTTANSSVVFVSGAIEGYANYAFVPGFTLGQG